MNGSPPALLAVFADPANGTCGAAWDAGGEVAGLLSVEGGPAEPATAELASGGGQIDLRLTAASRSATTQLPAPSAGDGEALGAAAAGCAVNLGSGPDTAARGLALSLTPAGPGELIRLVGLCSAGEEAIAAASVRPAGQQAHGDERSHGWASAGEEAAHFGEVLISTEYDGEGRQTRLGMELWPQDEDALPMRAAATAVGTAAGAGAGRPGVTAVIVAGASEGRPLLGAYVIAGTA